MQVVDSEGYLKVKLVGGPVGPFVPYTGATANVDLGEYELKAGQLTLDTSPTGTAVVGTTRWNNTIGSSETTLKGGSVILKNGVDLVARVVNKVTPNATLTKANYTAVRVSGAQGQRLAVAYAQANSDANSADTIGLVIETIATNQEGFIMTVGQIEGVNTTGSLQGETWADGDVLYLSPTTPGALTNIKPTGLTGHIVVMGYVEYAHVNNGKIYVKIMNGWELDELHNVYINPATLANNNILQYDSADQLWKNQVLSTGLTVGTTPISSGTIGRVLFQGTGNVLQQSSSLFWDSTNNRLGIGTSSPASVVEINHNPTGINDTTGLILNNGSLGSTLKSIIFNSGTTERGTFGVHNGSGEFRWGISSGGYFPTIYANGSERLRINTTGNVLINTTTDAGFRLDVNGTARVVNQATIQTLTIGLGNNSIATNTALGFQVLANANASNTGFNTGVGYQSLSSIVGNGYNTAVGYQALKNSTASTNTAVGYQAGLNNSASDNVFIGHQAGLASTNTSSTIAIGAYALLSNTTGTALTAIGRGALENATGGGNVAIGFWAGRTHTTGTNNIFIGNSSTGVSNTDSNRTWIGNSSTTSTWLAGNVLINTTTDAGFKLDVNGTARVQGVLTASANNITGVLAITNASTATSISMASLLASGATGDTYFSVGRALTNNNSALIGHSTVGGGNYAFITVYGRPANDFVVTSNGQVALGTSTPNASARFTIESTTQGFLPPRMTTTQKNAIASPAAGLVVYDTTLAKLCVYTTTWETITSL
jgi:hypothetical protein